MRYGVCGGMEMARVAHACGYDYWESSVAAILKPTEPEAAFNAVLDQMATLPLPCPALNSWFSAQAAHGAFPMDGTIWKPGANSPHLANAGLLVHAHIATIPKRLLPGAEPCDLAPFFDALARANYDERISFEGQIADPVGQLPPALALMRRLCQDAAR